MKARYAAQLQIVTDRRIFPLSNNIARTFLYPGVTVPHMYLFDGFLFKF